MAPAPGKKQHHGGGAGEDKASNVLQAVLLADSFTQRFRPTTIERPKVLLPLLNVPMIEYTLEWLAMNKVQEVFVFCCAHADQIKAYLADSKWARSREMSVQTIVSTSCLSMGEALRIVDAKDVINSDFILVSGDTVSNMNLASALEAHRARRVADKHAIFTMLMKPTHHPQQRLRMGDTETVVCLDPSTSRLLKHYEAESGVRSRAHFKIDATFFSERDNVQVRTDLTDTHISICAPEVLMLFSDNFDFANLKRDFVPGVLSEEELGSKLYVHEVEQGDYVARIHNLRSYDAVSRDILQRWCFPFVPESNLLWRGGVWGPSNYKYSRGPRYIEHHVSIDRSAQVSEGVCVGASTSIGDNSRIVQSVIGRGCRVGKNVDILGCYIQDNVIIQDGATLRYAMVCEDAVIQAGASVEAGCIISYNVVIAAKHTVPCNSCVTLCRQIQSNDSDDELEYAATKSGLMPSVPSGHQQLSDDESDEDSDAFSDDPLGHSLEKPTDLARQMAEAMALGRSPDDHEALKGAGFDIAAVGKGGAGYQWVSTEALDLSHLAITPPIILPPQSFQDEDGDADDPPGSGADTPHAAGRHQDVEDHAVLSDPENLFRMEVSETFLRCVKLRYDQNNAVIELNGLKIAEDRTFADLARYIFTTLLAMCLPAPAWVTQEYLALFPARGSSKQSKTALMTALKKHLTEWKSLLQRFLKDHEDQVELLLTYEDYCSAEGVFAGSDEQGSEFSDVFVNVFKLLYDEEVVVEEAFDAWAAEKKLDAAEDQVFLKKAEQFITWLKEADEDSSEEESD